MTPRDLQSSNPDPLQIAVLLLYYGANRNMGGEVPIHREIKGGAVDLQDKNQLSPLLHLASSYGWVEMVRALLGRGANVNWKDRRGQTPLHAVSQSAYVSEVDGDHIVKLLLEHGAEVDALDNNQATPEDIARHYGKLGIALSLSLYRHKGSAMIDWGSTLVELKGADLHDRPASR